MEQDFTADTFSVSEDSSDDENEEPQLDSAMGETGDDREVVDEKLRDNKDDEDVENEKKNEKYETGPSVKDNDESGRELRAKEDEDDVNDGDEPGELDPDESNKKNDENDDTDEVEDMNIDKDEAFSEPTGLKPDETNVNSDEDIDMEGDDDQNEDGETETVDESAEINNGEDENTNSVEENAEEENQEKNGDADVDEPKKDATNSTPVTTDHFGNEIQPNADSATQANGGSSMGDVAPEATWSNSNDMQSDVAPIRGGLPNSSENEVTVADSSKGGKLNDEHISQLPEVNPSSSQKSQPNPFRNIGDALDGWKERAKVSIDLEEKKDEAMDDIDADEYGFTSGLEKGSAQALGPATADQIDTNIDGKEANDGKNTDGEVTDKKDDSEMEIDEEQQHVEARPIKNHLSIENIVNEKTQVEETEIPDETLQVDSHGENRETESWVVMKRCYMTEGINELSKLSVGVGDDDMGITHDVSLEMKDSATALWRKYELQTTRLSQELAEQLRLVMEPTLASKLQGDYKTGKRINMKKV